MSRCTIRWDLEPTASTTYASHFGLEVPPIIGDELALRRGPLREQWEARGPGLLGAITAQLPWLVFPTRASVALVAPVRGGGCLLRNQRMYFEAVLANPHPSLPEVLRLSWLVARFAARIALDQPDADDHRLAFALIPYVLRGGEQVELSTCDADSIIACLSAWHLVDSVESALALELLEWSRTQPSDLLAQWWASTPSKEK